MVCITCGSTEYVHVFQSRVGDASYDPNHKMNGKLLCADCQCCEMDFDPNDHSPIPTLEEIIADLPPNFRSRFALKLVK